MAWPADGGWTVVEVLVVVGLLGVLSAVAAPPLVHLRDSRNGRQAAEYLLVTLRSARQAAILDGRHRAIVFDVIDGGWRFRRCADGTGDGVRRVDIAAAHDTCTDDGTALEWHFDRTFIGKAPDVPAPDGTLGGTAVALGTARMVSFSPCGTSSSGSIVLQTVSGSHWAVRVTGMTGRVRLMRFDVATGRWVDA